MLTWESENYLEDRKNVIIALDEGNKKKSFVGYRYKDNFYNITGTKIFLRKDIKSKIVFTEIPKSDSVFWNPISVLPKHDEKVLTLCPNDFYPVREATVIAIKAFNTTNFLVDAIEYRENIKYWGHIQ